MANPTIIAEEPMNLSQLRGEVDKIKKRDDKLNFRSQRTEE